MNPESIHAAVEAGKQLTQEHDMPGYRPVIAAMGPSGLATYEMKPEKLGQPRHLTACPTFHDASAFGLYVNAFKGTASRLFYLQDGNFLAVFDYHSGKDAAFGDHKAILALKRSPEWESWAKHSEQQMGQQAFAEFIEDNARDILQPDPETMLRVASGLHATVGATFRQATNQANGQIQLAFDETINGTVNGKEEAIPTTFQVGLRPFMGCERYPVDCRLRYRIDRSGGAVLKLHYKALHLDPITEAALEGIVAKVRDETGITPALGMHNSDAFARGI